MVRWLGLRGVRPMAVYLIFLCAAVALPILVLSGILLHRAVSVERAALEDETFAQARDLAILVDREVAGRVAMLEALATSSALLSGNLELFDGQARQLQLSQGLHIILKDVGGQQLINTRLPFGVQLPHGGDVGGTDGLVLETRRPQISNVFVGAVSRELLVRIAVPVIHGGVVTYILNASIPLSYFQQFLALSHIPGRWWGTVIDRDGVIVARSLNPAEMVGQRVTPAAQSAIAEAAPSNRLTLVSPEGVESYAALHRIGALGWTAAVAVPEAVLLKPFHDFYRWMAGLAALAALFSFVGAVAIGRMISRGVGDLASAAVRLQQGGKVELVSSPIKELNVAQAALSLAEADLRRVGEAIQEKSVAEAANDAKTTFLRGISHDLRQPFQAMRLYEEVLKCRVPPELAGVVEHLGAALTAGEEMVSAIVDLSVIESGALSVKPTAFALNSLLAEIEEECGPQARKANLTFRRVETTAWVRTDRALLRRVVRNLAVNAIRYTKEGGIVLGCRRHDGRVRIQIIDTGIGIPRDKLEAIFGEFVQAGNAGREQRKGLGLGLAIVQRLSGLLGYGISVASTIGAGSTFTVELDRLDTAQSAANAH